MVPATLTRQICACYGSRIDLNVFQGFSYQNRAAFMPQSRTLAAFLASQGESQRSRLVQIRTDNWSSPNANHRRPYGNPVPVSSEQNPKLALVCDNYTPGSTPINRTNHHPSPNMIGRSALTRGAQLALRRQDGAKLAQRRAYAATAGASTETASFESTEINSIKVASRDPRSPTTRLTVVAKAGTRYQPMPGLSVGLEEFAFKASRARHRGLWRLLCGRTRKKGTMS